MGGLLRRSRPTDVDLRWRTRKIVMKGDERDVTVALGYANHHRGRAIRVFFSRGNAAGGDGPGQLPVDPDLDPGYGPPRRRAQAIMHFDLALIRCKAQGVFGYGDHGRQITGRKAIFILAFGNGVCRGNGSGFVARSKYKLDDVGAIEALAKAGGRKEVDGCVPALAIDLPSYEVLAARRGGIVAGWRPHHPALVRHMGEEGQQLGAIGGAIPSDGAVTERGGDQAAIG